MKGEDAKFQKELAHFYFSNNVFLEAETVLKRFLENSPNDEEAQFGLALSLSQQNKLDESEELLKSLLRSNPPHADAHGCLGSVYQKQERFELARQEYNTCLKLNPEDEYARRMLELALWSIVLASPNRVYELLKDIAAQEGEEMANKVAAHVFAPPPQRQLSNEGQEHLSKAEELFRSKHYEEAIVEYKRLIEENSNFAPAYMGLGDCYYMMGDFHKAAEFFDRTRTRSSTSGAT